MLDVDSSVVVLIGDSNLSSDWPVGKVHVVKNDGLVLPWVELLELVDMGDKECWLRTVLLRIGRFTASSWSNKQVRFSWHPDIDNAKQR